MNAAVYLPETGITIEERAEPILEPDRLLIKVGAAGICGSDMHYYRDGHIGDWWVRQPHVLGHEFAGTVVAIGSGVNGDGMTCFREGDQVAIEPIIPCDRCHACRDGLYNLCQNLRFTGSPHTDGAFQEIVSVRPRFAHHLPDGMDLELAALVEPTSIAVHAVRRSGLTMGDSVAIIGAGPIGLLTLAAARAAGASDIYVADVDLVRLQMATQMGATKTIDASVDSVATLLDLTQGAGADVVFEAVGAAATFDQAVAMTKPGGRLCVIGVCPEAKIEIDFMSAQAKELSILPIYLGRNAFPAALALLADGRIDGRAIVTHRFPLAEMATAMDTAVERRGNAVKVIVNP